MGAGRVPAARVVVLAADALEGGRLVYRHGRGAVLVLELRVLHRRTQRGEAVRPAGPVGGVGLRRGEVERGHGRRLQRCISSSDRAIPSRDTVVMPRTTTRVHRKHPCPSSPPRAHTAAADRHRKQVLTPDVIAKRTKRRLEELEVCVAHPH